ncbi:MAG TPA: dioxygenase [Steroidobacteraceae bacterium]
MNFLTDAGHMTDDKRQEFILLSDVLGLSMFVIEQNKRKPVGCTEGTVFGHFHVTGPPFFALGADIANGAKGEPCYVNAVVKGLDGEVVAGAIADVWQADTDGLYDVQRSNDGQSTWDVANR